MRFFSISIFFVGLLIYSNISLAQNQSDHNVWKSYDCQEFILLGVDQIENDYRKAVRSKYNVKDSELNLLVKQIYAKQRRCLNSIRGLNGNKELTAAYKIEAKLYLTRVSKTVVRNINRIRDLKGEARVYLQMSTKPYMKRAATNFILNTSNELEQQEIQKIESALKMVNTRLRSAGERGYVVVLPEA